MPRRTIKISFHKVEITNPETPVNFNQILTQLSAVPNDRRRTTLITDEPVRLRALSQINDGRWRGDLARIRLHEAIDKSTIDGKEESIVFAEEEGPCEKTVFLYSPALNVIAIQQTAGAVSPSSCARYFRTLGQVGKIELPVLIKQEALERILRFGSATKFQIQLARINNAGSLRNLHASARNMMQFARTLNASTATIHVGLDREASPMEAVKQLVRDVLGIEERNLADVKKILVVGADEDAPDEFTAIDLLKDRIMEMVPVDLNDGERLADGHRYNAIQTAWDRQQAQLQALYGDQ